MKRILEGGMKLRSRDLIVWAPRVVGLGLALFLSLFAADAFVDNRGLLATTLAVVMGLAPALVVAASVLLGWRHQRIAAVVFFALTLVYSAATLDHPIWIAIIAGPLALVGGLFLVSWQLLSKERSASQG